MLSIGPNFLYKFGNYLFCSIRSVHNLIPDLHPDLAPDPEKSESGTRWERPTSPCTARQTHLDGFLKIGNGFFPDIVPDSERFGIGNEIGTDAEGLEQVVPNHRSRSLFPVIVPDPNRQSPGSFLIFLKNCKQPQNEILNIVNITKNSSFSLVTSKMKLKTKNIIDFI